jgi:phospholipid/cholesterol/gamma-HCH transport system ATP-binding protein
MPLLEIKNLRKSFKSQVVLDGVDLTIEKGESIVIIGRSGTGKSVLLKHINGLMKPDEGEVLYQGIEIHKLSEEELNPYRRSIGMLFQNGALFDSMSVEENVSFPLKEQKKFTAEEIRVKVAEALEMVELPGQQKKIPDELSGGMRKRVALARSIMTHPDVMMYDEPTTGLDPVISDSINKLVKKLGDRLGMTTIVVTHDMKSAMYIADRIIYIHKGKIYFNGKPEELMKSQDPLIKNFVEGKSEDQGVEE